MADRTMTVTDAPAATAAARARESYPQLAREEHARYYSAVVLSLSAPSAVVMLSREGYLRLVCHRQSQDGRR